MKRVTILGSTGSVGRQALQVIKAFPQQLKAVSLVTHSNFDLLEKQVMEFMPEHCGVISFIGNECMLEAVQYCDIAVVATSGIAALEAVLYCLQNGKEVALANKETLVCAGELVKAAGGKLVPIDSEHSAIMQCLAANPTQKPRKLLLTASGGPFWNMPPQQLHLVTPDMALRHPNWSMGQKITIDSATMMNKALEVVEAHFLFDVPPEDIQILVHRQSVVHSMVQWQSGSVMAQLAIPDMRLPIQLALLGESRQIVPSLNFDIFQKLTFEPCDFKKFPCARFGREIFKYPPLCRTAMLGANDVCVQEFLDGRLPFDAFYGVIFDTVCHFAKQLGGVAPTVENIQETLREARQFALQRVRKR